MRMRELTATAVGVSRLGLSADTVGPLLEAFENRVRAGSRAIIAWMHTCAYAGGLGCEERLSLHSSLVCEDAFWMMHSAAVRHLHACAAAMDPPPCRPQLTDRLGRCGNARRGNPPHQGAAAPAGPGTLLPTVAGRL